MVNWIIRVPARLAVVGELDAGNIEAWGVSGGARLRVGAGDIKAELEGGSVRAHASVGSVDVRYVPDSYALLELDAEVGQVDLRLMGAELERRRPPGAGDGLRMKGTGNAEIVLTAQVGDVRLDLGSPPGSTGTP